MTPDQASQLISDLLKLLVEKKGSDLFITADFPPALKIDGKMTRASAQSLSAEQSSLLVRALMNDRQTADFERTKESNFAISPMGLGRFRVNAFVQLGKVGMVLRVIPTTPPTIDGMGLPKVLKDVALYSRGLCVLVGASGSGKSTALAALVDWRN
jgi:twitching motility protein PilU